MGQKVVHGSMHYADGLARCSRPASKGKKKNKKHGFFFNLPAGWIRLATV